MFRSIPSYLLILSSLYSFGQNSSKKQLLVPELKNVDISINGQMDEREWSQSAKISKLNQYFPETDIPADGIASDLRIFYTQEGLYFAGILKDNRAPVLSQFTPRDRVNANTDWIQLIINPFINII